MVRPFITALRWQLCTAHRRLQRFMFISFPSRRKIATDTVVIVSEACFASLIAFTDGITLARAFDGLFTLCFSAASYLVNLTRWRQHSTSVPTSAVQCRSVMLERRSLFHGTPYSLPAYSKAPTLVSGDMMALSSCSTSLSLLIPPPATSLCPVVPTTATIAIRHSPLSRTTFDVCEFLPPGRVHSPLCATARRNHRSAGLVPSVHVFCDACFALVFRRHYPHRDGRGGRMSVTLPLLRYQR